MTSILQLIDNAISSTRDDESIIISETPKDDSARVYIRATMSSNSLKLWQIVSEQIPNWVSFEFKDEFDDIIQPSDGTHNAVHTVELNCASFKTNRYIFTIEGWNILLHNDLQISLEQQINILGLKTPFETHSFHVQPWVNEPEDIIYETKTLKPINAKSYVKFYSDEFSPPSNISPWILKNDPLQDDLYLKKWKEVSSSMLARCLVNELMNNGDKSVILTGKPPKKMSFGDPKSFSKSFDIIQETIGWIFLDNHDIEVKHTFMSSELAREWPENISLSDGIVKKLPLGYESAKLLYKAHLRSSSKETIKTLSDLRKTLTEDTQKIVNQARDIATSLWKDLALAISIIAVKYTLDASKVTISNKIFPYIFILVAIYILASQATTLFINRRYFKILEENSLIWRTKLYAFLDDEDYESLASIPVKNAHMTYNKVATLVLIAAILTFLLMSYLGLSLLIDTVHYLKEILHFLSIPYQCTPRVETACFIMPS